MFWCITFFYHFIMMLCTKLYPLVHITHANTFDWVWPVKIFWPNNDCLTGDQVIIKSYYPYSAFSPRFSSWLNKTTEVAQARWPGGLGESRAAVEALPAGSLLCCWSRPGARKHEAARAYLVCCASNWGSPASSPRRSGNWKQWQTETDTHTKHPPTKS